MILGEGRKRIVSQPANRSRFGACELVRLVMERYGAHRGDPEGAHLRRIQVRDGILFGVGRAGIQCLRFVPPALLHGDPRLRGDPLAVLVMLDPGHEDAFLRERRQTLRSATAIRHALKPTTPASAGRLLLPAAASQLVAETLPDYLLRSTVHTGHLQTQAVFEIVGRGIVWCDVVVHAGSGLRPPYGDESVGQLDCRENTGVSPCFRRIRLVRPCTACSLVGRLPYSGRPRPRAASVQIEVRWGPVMPSQADARGFRVRVGDRLGQPGMALGHVLDRQERSRRQAISSPNPRTAR